MPLKKSFTIGAQYLTLNAFTVSNRRKLNFTIGLIGMLTSYWFLTNVQLRETVPSYVTDTLLFLVIVLGVNLALTFIRFFSVTTHRRNYGLDAQKDDSFTVGTRLWVSTATIFTGAVALFTVFPIPFETFFTSLALVSVGVAIVFQSFITNFVRGLIMTFSPDFRIGDHVCVDSLPRAVIRDISFSRTRLRTDKGNTVYVSNNALFSNSVVNYSKSEHKKVAVTFTLHRHSVQPIEQFEQTLLTVLKTSFPQELNVDDCYLHITGYEDDEVSLSLEVPVDTFTFRLEDDIKNAIFRHVIKLETETSVPK